MSLNPSVPASDGPNIPGEASLTRLYWGPLLAALLVLFWFYGIEARYGSNRDNSALTWLWSAWNGENDYEHGPLFPLIIGGLIVHRFKSLKAAAAVGSAWGLMAVVAGALFYAVAYRTLQPRVAIGALPFLLWGSAWYLWGWRVAKILLFPLFFFWLAIPLPNFQQATSQLQLLATSMAHQGAALCGVETLVQGNQIASTHGGWEPLEIAKGCSGIHSLMALLMISGAWACLADMALWKRAVLFLSAFPLAILGNALRVTSIFVIAEYGDATWARQTWHDWSGLLLFYPFSLMLLLVIHALLEGGLPWRQANRRKLQRVMVTRPDAVSQPESQPPES
jgi:exosortase